MAEKTEAPSPRRLQEARERGQVVRSIEVNSAVALLTGTWLLQGSGKSLVSEIGSILKDTLTNLPKGDISYAWLIQLVTQYGSRIAPPIAQFTLGLMVIGIAITLLQTGIMFPSKKQFVDFSRLNPLSGIKRLLSLQGLVELLKSILKLTVVSLIAYSFYASNINMFLSLAQLDLATSITQFVGMAFGLVWRVGAAYFVLAAIDYIYQRWQFMRNMRMTKQEVIEEFKQSEGDPLLRGRIREQQRRMARRRMMQQVPKADVIITNPTHLAIAIFYDSDKMVAPKVLAKGSNFVAQKIVDVAKQNQVPVIQNIPLARALYRFVDLDQEIPPELYKAAAEILAQVYRMRSRYLRPANATI